MPRICFVTTSDIRDRNAFSGTVHHIHQTLRNSGAEIDVLHRLERLSLLVARTGSRTSRILFGSGIHQVERTESIARRSGRTIVRHLERRPADVIFSNSTTPVAELPGNIPVVVFTDATFKGLRELYPELRDYPKKRALIGEELERKAIQRATRLIYTSRWAANSAVNDYGADPSNVHVLPRGGDMGPALDHERLLLNLSTRSRERCELLLVGVSWQRKGGPLATQVLQRLIGSGIPARLTVVGCSPPKGTDRTHMEIHPFYDKGRQADLQQLLRLYDRSHFLLVPSEAECFGIVYAEASSRGLPALARDSGGVQDAIRNGCNGQVFDFNASAQEYAAYLASYWNDRETYERLCWSSFEEYRTRLNWALVGKRLMQIMQEAADQQR